MPARIKIPLLLLIAASSAMLLLLLAGCSILNDEGSVDPALASCPQEPIAADVRVDASGSSSTSEIVDARLKIIESVIHRTALCEGHLHVEVFSSSSGSSVELYDADLSVDGATDQAKSRRVGAVVDKVSSEIAGKYDAAVAALPRDGSDITAQLRLASEYSLQFPGYQLDEYILTDGFSNIGVDLESSLSAQQATKLASTVPVPVLSNAWVTIAGIGRVDDNSSSSAQTEALVAFYSTLCSRTEAGSCTVVTDFAARW